MVRSEGNRNPGPCLGGLPPHGDGLGLDALHAIKHRYCAVQNAVDVGGGVVDASQRFSVTVKRARLQA
jgi:hypothetical protein